MTLTFWGETNYSESSYIKASWTTGTTGPGDGKLFYDTTVGVEAFSDKSLAFLEKGPEYSIERWDISASSASYTGKSIRGHGSEDYQFNNPQDITIDSDDLVYVLDINSDGSPRIKIFDADLLPIGGMGDSTSITGNPIRIDWDDYNNTLHVLTSSGVVKFPK